LGGFIKERHQPHQDGGQLKGRYPVSFTPEALVGGQRAAACVDRQGVVSGVDGVAARQQGARRLMAASAFLKSGEK